MPYLKNRDDILDALENNPKSIRRLWIEAGFESQYDRFIKKAKEQGISFRIIPKELFSKRFKDARAHICLERDEFSYTDPDSFLLNIKDYGPSIFICAFDGIYDPQNLGNIIRSAVCFNVHAIILPKDRSCGITDAVISVSKGAVERINIVKVINLARYIEDLKKAGIYCLCLDENGEARLSDMDLRQPICLVFGSEEGTRRLTRQRCDGIARIPTSKGFASLNVATSFAVATYEVLRQRGFGI
ncbi:MAG: RNA methyltransferase [Syntrophorhabdaceae bacterium]|nr:RNA methyltransferase [Syntrophorhabdaceae bacterium]